MLKINGSWINLFLWSDEQSKSTIDFEFVQLDSYLEIIMSMHSVGLVFNILTLIVIEVIQRWVRWIDTLDESIQIAKMEKTDVTYHIW